MKIVLVGQDQDRLNKIKEQIDPLKSGFEKFSVKAVNPLYAESAIDRFVNVLILDAVEVSQLVFPMVHKIRSYDFSGPILLLAHLPANFDLSEIAQEKSFYFLKKPYKTEQLIGVVKNCIQVQGMKQRRAERFDVREQATLQAYSSDFTTETIINNISKSGVRIEGNLSGLKKGDLLRLHFNFDKIKKERVMSARVVWMKKEDDSQEQAGLEFVSQEAVYKYLLTNAIA